MEIQPRINANLKEINKRSPTPKSFLNSYLLFAGFADLFEYFVLGCALICVNCG